MSKQPELKIVLTAGGVEVATSADTAIWLSTMAAITGCATSASARPFPVISGASSAPDALTPSQNPVSKFAAELGVAEEALQGAASPSLDAPFIHLDHKYWEALKQNTPPRGVGSVPGVVLAATLLLLWSRHSNFGKIAPSMCDGVLATIGHSERNRARSLKGCEWIQVREDGLRLNPANVQAAIKLASTYVSRSPK